MEKILHIGSVMLPHTTSTLLPTDIFCKVVLESGKLAITGVIGPRSNGDAWGASGQIDIEFDHRDPSMNDARYSNPIKASDITFAEGWDAKRWSAFLFVWKRWHMNDMRAACEHQRALGWDTERIDPNYPGTDYRKWDGRSYSWNLKGWVYAPLGYLREPCPVCGYKYGTKWLSEALPEPIIMFVESLPDASKTPAWV